MGRKGSVPMVSISYIAGFFDADGCVHYHKKSKCWYLIFSNDNKKVLTAIKKTLHVKTNIQLSKRPKGKIGYTLVIGVWRDIRRIGLLLRPFLVVKKAKIEKMLKFIDTHEYREGKFTLTELDFMRSHRHLTADQVGTILGRTKQAIQSKRRKTPDMLECKHKWILQYH